MSYQKERDEFISRATAEGLSLDTCRKLLRYATTLQRLAEAQCNGDWPYNGDRDRPSTALTQITEHPSEETHMVDTSRKARERHDARYTVCPKCEASGVAKSAMRPSDGIWVKYGTNPVIKICPDCRTQELVYALLSTTCPHCKPDEISVHYCSRVEPIFQGDPRGAVLKLATPGYPWSDDGRKGYGLYVPARVRWATSQGAKI